jgi:hypothetical protein
VKKTVLVILFTAAFTMPLLMAQSIQDFTLVNKTGLAIDQLFISATDKAEWDEDILGVDILPEGAEVDVKFHPAEKSCRWDLKIIDTEGNAVEWTNINLCEASVVTLYWKDGKATAEIEKGSPAQQQNDGEDEDGQE